MVVHGTRRFRDRVPGEAAAAGEVATTLLGAWYATLLRWRSPVALLVNEATLLPVLVRCAPARTLVKRIPGAIGDVLAAHQVPPDLIAEEQDRMAECRLTATTNRSVVGVMNEFGFLADLERADTSGFETDSGALLALTVRLASTPCGPLYQRHVSPDRELAAIIANHRSDR